MAEAFTDKKPSSPAQVVAESIREDLVQRYQMYRKLGFDDQLLPTFLTTLRRLQVVESLPETATAHEAFEAGYGRPPFQEKVEWAIDTLAKRGI